MRQAGDQRLAQDSGPGDYPEDGRDRLATVPGWLYDKYDRSGGRLAVVFGCGPSLEAMGPVFWGHVGQYVGCGVNGFPILEPVRQGGYVPDVWCCIDRERQQERSYPGFRQAWAQAAGCERPLRLMASANRSDSMTDLFFDYTPMFKTSRGYCKYGRSAVQAATHWLINELAPKVVVCFGVDYNGPGRAGGLSGNNSHQPGPKLEKAFEEFRVGCAAMGADVVNASPGTGLGALPVLDWKEIL